MQRWLGTIKIHINFFHISLPRYDALFLKIIYIYICIHICVCVCVCVFYTVDWEMKNLNEKKNWSLSLGTNLQNKS